MFSCAMCSISASQCVHLWPLLNTRWFISTLLSLYYLYYRSNISIIAPTFEDTSLVLIISSEPDLSLRLSSSIPSNCVIVESAESAERTLSGYDENVEAIPYRCM